MRPAARIQGMSPGRIARLAGIAATTALLATACAGSGGAGSPSSGGAGGTGSSPRSSPSTTPTSGAVPEILRFTAPVLGGGELRGEDLVRQDVAMWFWAPW